MTLAYEIAARDIARQTERTAMRSQAIRQRARDRSRRPATRSNTASMTGVAEATAWSHDDDLGALLLPRRRARMALELGLLAVALGLVAVVAGTVRESVFLTTLIYGPAFIAAALAVRWGRSVRWSHAMGGVSPAALREATVAFWCGLLTLLPTVYLAVAIMGGVFLDDVFFFQI